MGKHVRKRKRVAMFSVTEKETVVVSRKRKMLSDESELQRQSSGEDIPENAASPFSSGDSTCESGGSGHVSASCCSSTVAEESTKFADLKENEAFVEFSATTAGDSVDFRDRREKTEGEPTETNPRGCSAAEEMATESELEEFFAAAETNLQRKFIDKYNYDIAKDEPLEGLYEWSQVSAKTENN